MRVWVRVSLPSPESYDTDLQGDPSVIIYGDSPEPRRLRVICVGEWTSVHRLSVLGPSTLSLLAVMMT